MTEGEIPVQAAIRMHDSGEIFVGTGHGAAHLAAHRTFQEADDEASLNALMREEFEQGFVTSRGRFVDRQEAHDLAVENAGHEPSGSRWFDHGDLRDLLDRQKSAPGAHALYR